jgi:hypothetical protein
MHWFAGKAFAEEILEMVGPMFRRAAGRADPGKSLHVVVGTLSLDANLNLIFGQRAKDKRFSLCLSGGAALPPAPLKHPLKCPSTMYRT